MIYSPSYGDIAFTAPLINEFLRRTIQTFEFGGQIFTLPARIVVSTIWLFG
jgi:hypothetical protein